MDTAVFEKNENSRGLAELFGVAGTVLVPSLSEPGLDLSLGESTLLRQAHHLTLNTQTQTDDHIYSVGAHIQGWTSFETMNMFHSLTCERTSAPR